MSQVAAPWQLALPMYNVTPGLERLWLALLQDIRDALRGLGWARDMQIVQPPDDLLAFWRGPDLLLSQTCGYPLVNQLGTSVRVLAVPEFVFPGCEGIHYRSAIVVPQHGAACLEALRDRVAAINQHHSHSGMNALRHTVAPLARDGRFFSNIRVSGSHMASLAMVQRGQADVAAIDCVTLGLARRYAPATCAGLRVLQHTARAPGLPLITAATLSADQLRALRAVVLSLPQRAGNLLAQLGVRRLHSIDLAGYADIRQQAEQAREQGYPDLT